MTPAFTLLLLTFAALALSTFAQSPSPQSRPNILFILMDDHRFDDLACAGHPFVKTPHIDRIAREGALFKNAFVTTPLCSPSRSTFLTGQYAHRTGNTDNTARDKRSHELVTFPRLLHDAGYETAFIGKWHMGTDDTPRPGFDFWVSVKGQGEYFNPALNVNGKTQTIQGYVTDIFTDQALEFLKRHQTSESAPTQREPSGSAAGPNPKPFCLFLAHKAVHPDLKQNPDGSLDQAAAAKNFFPAERHRHLYADQTPPRRPNYGPPTNKPALERKIDNLPPLSRETGTDDETIRNRLRMLAAVDEGVGRLVAALEASNQLDNTLVVFTSDEGYFYGEHGLSVERRLAYEESIRIPLLIRYPKLIKPGTTIDPMILNLDIAPTLLDLAGVKIPEATQGRSFLPLLQGKQVPWRDAFLIEYYTDKVFARAHKMGYKAVRTNRWKYIHYLEIPNADELYDLQTDPYEMNNRINDATSTSTLDHLKAELATLLK